MPQSTMKRSLLAAGLAIATMPGLANAATVDLNSFDNGWYNASGSHTPSNDNIVLRADGRPQINNFFAFDLAGLGLSTITSATLTIFGGSLDSFVDNGRYYQSSSDSETVDFYDVTTSISDLLDGTGGVSAFNDLMSGAVFASATILTPGSTGAMPEVKVTLSAAAVAAINAAISGVDQRFAIGGTSQTLTGSEEVWAFSGVIPAARLSLTDDAAPAVPVPAGLPLLLGGFAAFGALRLRTKS